MNAGLQFAASSALVVAPALAGWRDRRVGRWRDPAGVAGRIQAVSIVVLTPLVVALALWLLPIDERLPKLTAIAGGLSLIQLIAGLAWARARGLERARAGSLAIAASLSNTGATLGGFICFVFLGEEAFGLTIVYNLAIIAYTFGVCFPFARAMGAGSAGGWRALALATARDPKVVSPLLGIALGLALAAWAGPRPRALGDLQAVVVPASTAAVMYAVGLTLDVARVGAYLGDCLGMCALKFAASPLVALGLVLLVAPGHDAARVALLLATMPSAINATVIASLFRLDVDAANACFLVTTGAFLALVLPVIAIVLRGA